MPQSDMHVMANPDDGRRSGMSGSNTYQVCGLYWRSNEGKGEGVKS